MKKVIEDYIGFISLYKEITLGVWYLTFKITSWMVRILKKLEISLEFYFVKNGNKLLLFITIVVFSLS